MGQESRNAFVGVLAFAGLAAALTACNGSGNGPNGSASTAAPVTSKAATTPVTTGTTPVATAPVAPAPPVAAVQTNSKFLMTGNFLSNDVSVFNIAATVGTLTSSVAAPTLTQSPAMPNAMPTAIATDSGGNFLFVADSGTNALDLFTVDRTTGALTRPVAPAMPTIATGVAPYAIVVDPTNKFLYTANAGDNTVSAFQIQAGGSLAPCPTIPTAMVGSGPEALAFDPTGKFLYVANANAGTLSVLSIDATGNPTVVGAPVPTGQGPLAIATVNTGTTGFVYVANNLDSTVSVFQIGAAGALTAPATGATVPLPNAGIGPSAMVADPTGSFLYTVNGFQPTGSVAVPTNDISAFTITASTGALTAIGTTNTKAGVLPTAIVANASGRVLYVTDGLANAVLTFGIDPQTGALIAEGSTPTGSGPVAVFASN